jgi:hypothetical protein
MRFLKIFIISVFIALSLKVTDSFSQERENKPLPVIAKTALWTLTEATGWVISADGQWLSAKNKIECYGLNSTEKTGFTKGRNAVGIDNFAAWEARDITIGGKDFLLITKSLTTGWYKNRYLPDFSTIDKTIFMVVKKNSAKLEKKSDDTLPHYKLHLYYYGAVENGINSLAEISANVNASYIRDPEFNNVGTDNDLTIYYAENKDPKNCRFFALATTDAVPPGKLLLPFYTDFLVKGEWINFNKAYFELPTAKFAGLLGVIKVTK